MENATHCRQIVDAFIQRGMEFQQQRPRTARPGTGRPVTASQQDRLLTANSSSPYFEPTTSGTRSSPPRTQLADAGSLPRLPTAKAGESPPRSRDKHEHAPTYFQDMPPPSFLTRDESTAPREAVPSRPSTAQVYRSYTTPSQAAVFDPHEVPRTATDPTYERPSSTSRVAAMEAIREAVEAEASSPPRSATHMPPPSLRSSNSNEHWTSGTLEPAAVGALSSDPAEPRPQIARPSTSATITLPETFDFELPPRRELPFKRPDSRRSGSGQSSSRPGSSALTMPPLPKPKLVTEGSGSPVRADSLSPMKEIRPGTASPLKRSFNAVEDEVARPQTTMATVRTPSPAKQMRISERPTSPEPTARKPARMEELLYGRKPLGDRSTNSRVPRTNSLADAPHEEIGPPPSPPKSTQLANRDPTVNAYAALRAQSHGPREVALEEYATQSLQDRQSALDEFMVENLENPAFTKLCEDVENCWRRMALGL